MKEKWLKNLTPEQKRICYQCGTEPAFRNKYWNLKEIGTYHCICCDQELFSSSSKFDSGSGWPSFTNPISSSLIEEHEDRSFGMLRTEVKCNNCKSHLGHVFDDGPGSRGLRYCINSTSLNFKKKNL
ncbi:MAG: peptide-methionine (R)-S-oxide reductase [Methanobacteriota archaeon]|nr:MAG: peptide-methionine (R)-S-oxide reductase [Euryarchaeota archaeon]|tara:strand:- start:1005 stop:1385 length:381 start_codon:yes stop_codon:yes gene_type:complete